MSWLIPRSRLTAEQIRAVELPPTEHRLVLGGPGSGKTQVLLHRAAFLRDRFRVSPERYRIFVFTNTLTSYIKSALNDLEIPETSVSTLDSWCIEYHRTFIGRPPMSEQALKGNRRRSQPDFPAVRRAVADHILRQRRPPTFDFVLVDEGQDLDDTVFRLLCGVSRHVTVCMDRKQKIYETGADELTILRELGLRKRNLALLDALRCSPYIINVASALVEDPEEGRELVVQTRTSVVERETPVVYCADNFADERRRLVEIIKVRQSKGDRVAILLARKNQVFGFATGLAEEGLTVETQDNADFRSDAPKLLTYHSAKGLTFDSVLMPRLVHSSFRHQSRQQIERLLFVGVSRAVKWAYFSTYSTETFEPLDKVVALAKLKQVTVQGASRLVSPGDSNRLKPDSGASLDEEGDLDFL